MLEHVLDELVEGADRADDIAILAARFLPRPKPLDLEVASRERSLHLVRDAIRTWLEGRHCRGRMRRTSCAAWEVCANAIVDAADPFDDVVRIRADVTDARVRSWTTRAGSFRSRRASTAGSGFSSPRSSPELDITTSERGTRSPLEKNLPLEGDG